MPTLEQASLGVWEAQPQALCISEVECLCNTLLKVTTRHLCVDGWSYHELHHAHGDMVPFRVLCAIRTQLRSCWWFRCTLFFASRASSHYEHDMGSLSWLNAETLKRAPTPPLWQICKVLHPWTLICKTTVMLFSKALFWYSKRTIFWVKTNNLCTSEQYQYCHQRICWHSF